MSVVSFQTSPETSIGNTMINLGIAVLMSGALLFERMLQDEFENPTTTTNGNLPQWNTKEPNEEEHVRKESELMEDCMADTVPSDTQ